MNPEYAEAYNNRGLVYKRLSKQKKKEGDEQKAEECRTLAKKDFEKYKELTGKEAPGRLPE